MAAARADVQAARTAQTRAEAAQQAADHARVEAQATVEQLRAELAELRQQHRAELAALRAENRADRDQLRAEHRDQLTDLRMLAGTAEQRADRAEALLTEQSQRAVRDEPLRNRPARKEGGGP